MVLSFGEIPHDESGHIDLGCDRKDVSSWVTTFQSVSSSLLRFSSSFIVGIYVWMILGEVGCILDDSIAKN